MEWSHIKESAGHIAEEVHRSKLLKYSLFAACLILLGLLLGQCVPRSRRSAVVVGITFSLTLILVLYYLFLSPHLFPAED